MKSLGVAFTNGLSLSCNGASPSFTVCHWHRLLTDAQLHSPPTFAV